MKNTKKRISPEMETYEEAGRIMAKCLRAGSKRGSPLKKTLSQIRQDINKVIEDDDTSRGNNITPDLSIDIVVTDIGYQMDVYEDGELGMIECRDFGGSPRKKRALTRLGEELKKAIEAWRKSL